MSTQLITTAIALLLVIGAPSLLHFGFRLSGRTMKRVLGVNLLLVAVIAVAGTLLLSSGAVLAEPQATDTNTAGWAYMAAALAAGLASIGAGIATSSAAAAALGAISEDPGIMGRALIFVALAEGIALYGLLIAFTILGRI